MHGTTARVGAHTAQGVRGRERGVVHENTRGNAALWPVVILQLMMHRQLWVTWEHFYLLEHYNLVCLLQPEAPSTFI